MIQFVQNLILVTLLLALFLIYRQPQPAQEPRSAASLESVLASRPASVLGIAGAVSSTDAPGATGATSTSASTTASPLAARVETSSTATSVKELLAGEIALLQFDSRPLGDYWQSSAVWNRNYCSRHGHVYLYYSLRQPGACRHSSGEALADPWCKVLTMLRANADYPNVKLFVYIDSDAVIDERFADNDLGSLLGVLQTKLSWDMQQRPVVFNQDGPCWWCKLVASKGYPLCLNAGTVVWHRHQHATRILEDWWAAAMDEQLEGNPLKRRFRLKWPWEQDRQMALYNRTPEHIQVAPQPDKAFMDIRAGHHDWCLSHLPRSGCFVSHHCENAASKLRMRARYDALSAKGGLTAGDIHVDLL